MKLRSILFVFVVLFFLAFSLQAQTWSTTKQLTYTGGGGWDPAIATDTVEGVHLVWERDSATYMDIFYKGSLAWGGSWLAPERLCWNSGQSENPDIAVDSTGIKHVVWMDYTPLPLENIEIFYKHSALAVPWSPLIQVSWTKGNSTNPAIAIDSSDSIHIVWVEYEIGNGEIVYKNSTNSGGVWSTTHRLTWNSDYDSQPAIAVDSSDNIHIAWTYRKINKSVREVHHKVSTDGGNTWSSNNRLTLPSDNCRWPDIAADTTGGIHVVWTKDFTGKSDVIYRTSQNGGSTWITSLRLTWSAGHVGRPKVAASTSGGIHIAYVDYTPGNGEIFYKESTDSGTTWLAPERLTWNTSSSYTPQIAVDKNGGVHVVWRNETWHSAAWEIFYRNKNTI